MKYALLFPQTSDIVEYTVSVLRHLAQINGHSLTTPSEADILAVSVCDVSQVAFVEKVRVQYPHKVIIVGGHAAIYYRLFGLFADLVNIGQGFEAFACQTIQALRELPCVWTSKKAGSQIISSRYIDWAVVPVANVTNRQRYYWGATGCKNKCAFCCTSWTNPHQQNSQSRVAHVLAKYPNTTIVTNDSDNIPSRMTQSIMLIDFLKKPLKKYGVYRMGIEFATEATRRRYGKPFSDNQFRVAISRAVEHGVRLKLFCIGGINDKQEWRDLFDSVPAIYQKGNFEVKMTNVMYDPFTPLKRERMAIDHRRMWRTDEMKQWIATLKLRGGWPFKALPCATPEDAMRKNALLYVMDMTDYQRYKDLKGKTADQIQSALVTMFFPNDYSATIKIDHRRYTDASGYQPGESGAIPTDGLQEVTS